LLTNFLIDESAGPRYRENRISRLLIERFLAVV